MTRSIVGKGMRVGAMVGIFAAGWFCGTVTQRNAEAQLGDMGK